MKNMLSNAIILATNAHAGQFDKGGAPYILHPLKVMRYLKTEDEELMCIAVLHDILESSALWGDHHDLPNTMEYCRLMLTVYEQLKSAFIRRPV